MRFFAVLVVMSAVAACGGGDGPTDGSVDTGTRDTSVDTTIDAMVATTTITFVFTDPEEAPLADVKVAADNTGSGMRVEGISDAAGMLTLAVPAEMDDNVTFTYALEGYTIISVVDVVLGEFLGRFDGPVEAVLSPLEELLGRRTDFRVMATGLPSGGRLCAMHGTEEGGSWGICAEPDAAWNFMVPTRSIGDEVNVWAVDDTGTPVDFAVVPIATGETTVTAEFDGSFETAPTMRSVRLDFPDDPESPLVTATELPAQWHGWFSASVRSTNRSWSIAYNARLDGSDVLADVMIMTPPAGAELAYGVAAWAQLASLQSVAFASFMTDPGDTVAMMGFPHLTGGAALADTFTFDAPAAVAGDDLLHTISMRNSGGRTVWQLVSRAPSIQAPELPSEYDTDVTFPFPGAAGVVVAQSRTLLDMNDLRPGIDLDYRSSVSSQTAIEF